MKANETQLCALIGLKIFAKKERTVSFFMNTMKLKCLFANTIKMVVAQIKTVNISIKIESNSKNVLIMKKDSAKMVINAKMHTHNEFYVKTTFLDFAQKALIVNIFKVISITLLLQRMISYEYYQIQK